MKQQNSSSRLPLVLTAVIVVSLLMIAVTAPSEEPASESPPEAAPTEEMLTEEMPTAERRPLPPIAQEIEIEMPEADDDSIWELDDVGARLVKPVGWISGASSVRRYLAKDGEDWHAGSVNQMKVPNLFGHDLQGLLQENLDEIEDNPAFELVESTRLRINNRDVLRFDYTGRNDDLQLRIVCVAYLYGSQKIVLTWAARETDWSGIEEEVEQAISTLWVRPVKTESK